MYSPHSTSDEEARRVQKVFSAPGAHKVIIAAKDLRAMELGLRLADKGGTVLFFATPHPDESIPLYPSYIFFNEITLTTSYSADHLDTRIALELLSNGAVNGERLISHRFPLEQLSEAILQTAGRQESLKCVVTFDQTQPESGVGETSNQEAHAV